MDMYDKFFKTPDQDEIDRKYITQLCYDGQMADEEIDEFVDAMMLWKNKAINEKLFEIIQGLKGIHSFNEETIKELIISKSKKIG